MMHLHHDATMRTTVDLPEDLHRIALALARHNRVSLSRTVADLMRRGLESRVGEGEPPAYRIDDDTGLPVVSSKRPITPEDVKRLDDEP